MSSPRPQTLEGPLGIPVFCPSAEEFQDFYGYVKSIQSFGHQYGLVKVIPPEGYAQKTLDEALQTVGSLSIRSPIRQEFSGGGLPSGCYRQLNLDVRKTFSVADWFAASREPNHQTPILKEDGKIHIAPTAAGYSGMKRRGSMGKETPPAVSEEDALTMKDEDEEETKDVPSSSSVEKESSSANCSTEEGPAHPPEEDLDSDQTLLGVDGDESEQPAKRFKGSPLNPELEEYIRHGASKEYADIGLLKDLERFYWKNLSYLSPMYGADLLGTLFEPEAGNSWNVAALDNLLTRIQIPIAGVNTPYLYFGHWKATFAWHLEDMDLSSINYIHFGAPKQWYVIPPSHRHRFEQIAKSFFFDENNACPEYLRHKGSVISPSVLSSMGIPVHRIIHRPGEFMLTFPNAYHQGFNYGFNCAESTNFALDSWLPVGRCATFCECVNHSVRLDMTELFHDDTPPAPFNAEKWLEAVMTHVNRARLNPSYKIKPPREAIQRALKAMQRNRPIVQQYDDDDESGPGIKINEKTKCFLCPSSRLPMLHTADGRRVHRLCAILLPETNIVVEQEPLREVVTGVDDIVRDRWNLKCDFCKTKGRKYGACIQCGVGRCTHSFHVSCAREQQLTLFDEDGDPLAICLTHDPARKAQKKKEQEETLEKYAIEFFTPGVPVVCRWGNYTYEGVISEQRLEEKSCIVDFTDGSGQYTAPWTSLKLLKQEPEDEIIAPE